MKLDGIQRTVEIRDSSSCRVWLTTTPTRVIDSSPAMLEICWASLDSGRRYRTPWEEIQANRICTAASDLIHVIAGFYAAYFDSNMATQLK